MSTNASDFSQIAGDQSSSANPSSATRRVNVVFSSDQFRQLQHLAESQEISLSDALRQAISLSTFLVNANADKHTQILLKKGDAVQELKLVR